MKNNIKDPKKQIDAIKKNDIASFFLCDKELSLSNFLAQLLNRSFAGEFPLTHTRKLLHVAGEEYAAKREKRHIDLTIENARSVVVIEVKLKSEPSCEQLIDYSKKIEGNAKSVKKILLAPKVLLNCTKEGTPIPQDWKSCSLERLVEALRKDRKNIKVKDADLKKILTQYINYVSALCGILRSINTAEGSKILPPQKLLRQLGELKLKSLYKKVHVAKLTEKIKKKLKARGTKPYINHEYYSPAGEALNIGFADNEQARKEENRVACIQIQGEKLRVGICIKEDSVEKLKEGVYREIDEIFGKAGFTPSGRDCKFRDSKNGRRFCYRYLKIEEEDTVGAIFKKAKALFDVLEERFPQISKKFLK